MSTICDASLPAAFSYFADRTVPEMAGAMRGAAIAIDVLGFEVGAVLFGPELSDLGPFFVIVGLCGQICPAIAAKQAAKTEQFGHIWFLNATSKPQTQTAPSTSSVQAGLGAKHQLKLF
jgi:hypothetical protein